jgi:hypothetical protein
VSAIERLAAFLAEHYRWGLHPLKLMVALLAPVLVVWLADRRLRMHAKEIGHEGPDRPAAPHSPSVTTTR